jgi:hypothetical protein
MTFDASPSAYGSRFHRSFPLRITLPSIIFITAAITSSGGSPPRNGTIVLPIQQEDSPEQNYYANAHPYLEESLDTLRKRIPELGKIHPADDLQQLPGILQKTASNVDSFFRDIVDVIANEKITQERLDSRGLAMASERVPDNYLILRHLNAARADIVEYRMDDQGNRMDHPGLNEGYFATLGFALICNYFSTAFQPELKFRYLGDQKIGPQDSYVVAFAQQPAKATLFVTMAGRGGTRVPMLIQGVAWVEKVNFQIIRMRMDLLASRPEIGLQQLTTVVTVGKVQLLDVATPLWLPKEVKVDLKFREFDPAHANSLAVEFRNAHQYVDYRRYRVSVKVNPQH